MIYKYITRSTLLLLFSVFGALPAFTQDTITLNDGTELSGKVTINYNEANDVAFISSQEEGLTASQIQQVVFENGVVLIGGRIVYYKNSTTSEVEKDVFLTLLIDGDAKLYTYRGRGFNYVLGTGNSLQVLQNIPVTAQTQQVNGYRSVLLASLSDCLDRQEIFEASLNRNTLSYLFNTYNLCKNLAYSPLVLPKEKTSIFIMNLGGGINRANVTLSAPAYVEILGNLGDFDLDEEPTGGRVIDLNVQKNLFNSEKIFLAGGLSSRIYNIELGPVGGSGDFDDIKMNEILLNAGLNIKPLGIQRIYPEVETGLFYGFVRYPTVRSWDPYPDNIYVPPILFSDNDSKKNTYGIYVQTGFAFQVKENLSLFANARYNFRDTENFITDSEKSYFGYEAYDSIERNYTITFGLRITSIRVGFF